MPQRAWRRVCPKLEAGLVSSQRERAMSDMQSDRVQCYKCFSGSVFIRGKPSAIGTLALLLTYLLTLRPIVRYQSVFATFRL